MQLLRLLPLSQTLFIASALCLDLPYVPFPSAIDVSTLLNAPLPDTYVSIVVCYLSCLTQYFSLRWEETQRFLRTGEVFTMI